ncbi:hypothetical protein TYRP_023173 [Tyrophagus putrescentiae]|nr:hypothetical protein TYRP_023173 [Tyrophagus putrescentiae]
MANQLVIELTNLVMQTSDEKVNQKLYELYDDPSIDNDPNEVGESYLLQLDRRPTRATFYEGTTNQTFPPMAVSVFVFVDWTETVALVAGRRGANIIHVRAQTETWISSPRLNSVNDLTAANGKYNCKFFVIRAVNEARAKKAALILLLLARYYRKEVNSWDDVFGEEVGAIVFVPREKIREVTGPHGRWVNALQDICAVRIVTPKAYANVPSFSVLGLETNVCIATHCLKRRMELLANPVLAAAVARNNPTFIDDPLGPYRHAVSHALHNGLWNFSENE